MKISVVTINLNDRPGLTSTLRSITRQIPALNASGHTLQHIIVDGYSTDKSIDSNRDLIDTLKSDVVLSAPAGVYNAINIGISRTDGHIVGLLHAGDTFGRSDTLTHIAHAFDENPEVDYVYGDVTIGRRYYSGKGFNRASAATGFAPPHPSLYMRRNLFDAIGPYDETFSIAADFDYFIRLLNATRFKARYMASKIVEMKPGGRSQSLRNRLWINNTERLKILKKNGIPSSRLRLAAHYFKILRDNIIR